MKFKPLPDRFYIVSKYIAIAIMALGVILIIWSPTPGRGYGNGGVYTTTEPPPRYIATTVEDDIQDDFEEDDQKVLNNHKVRPPRKEEFFHWINWNLRHKFQFKPVISLKDMVDGKHLMAFALSIFSPDTFKNDEAELYENPETNFQEVHMMLFVRNRANEISVRKLVEGDPNMMLTVLQNILYCQLDTLWPTQQMNHINPRSDLSFQVKDYSDGFRFSDLIREKSEKLDKKFPYSSLAVQTLTVKNRVAAILKFGSDELNIPQVFSMEDLLAENVSEDFIKLYLGYIFVDSNAEKEEELPSKEAPFVIVWPEEGMTQEQINQNRTVAEENQKIRTFITKFTGYQQDLMRNLTYISDYKKELLEADPKKKNYTSDGYKNITNLLAKTIKEKILDVAENDFRQIYEMNGTSIKFWDVQSLINNYNFQINLLSYVAIVSDLAHKILNFNHIEDLLYVNLSLASKRLDKECSSMKNSIQKQIYDLQLTLNYKWKTSHTAIDFQLGNGEALRESFLRHYSKPEYYISIEKQLNRTKENIDFTLNVLFPNVTTTFPDNKLNANITTEMQQLSNRYSDTFEKYRLQLYSELPNIIKNYRQKLDCINLKINNIAPISAKNVTGNSSQILLTRFSNIKQKMEKLKIYEDYENILVLISITRSDILPQQNYEFNKYFNGLVEHRRLVYHQFFENLNSLSDTIISNHKTRYIEFNTTIDKLEEMREFNIHEWRKYLNAVRELNAIRRSLYSQEGNRIIEDIEMFSSILNMTYPDTIRNAKDGLYNLLDAFVKRDIFDRYYELLERVKTHFFSFAVANEMQTELISAKEAYYSITDINPFDTSDMVNTLGKLHNIMRKCNLVLEVATLQEDLLLKPDMQNMLHYYANKIKTNTVELIKKVTRNIELVGDLSNIINHLEFRLQHIIYIHGERKKPSVRHIVSRTDKQMFTNGTRIYDELINQAPPFHYHAVTELQDAWNLTIHRMAYIRNKNKYLMSRTLRTPR